MGIRTLKISFEKEDLRELLSADQTITIIKSCGVGGDEKDGNVNWVSFAPMQNNTVTWDTIYAVYASFTGIQNNAKIETVACERAKDRYNEYVFGEANVFDSRNYSGGKANFYYIHNSNTREAKYTFGLAQDVKANNAAFEFNPINAVEVFKNQHASFNPIEKIKIYMENKGTNGKVNTDVVSDALEVDFTTAETQKIRYDKNTSMFVPA